MEPAVFRRALETFDSLLSVRWGDVHGNWVIERKAIIPETEIGYLARREARLRYWAKSLTTAPSSKPDIQKMQVYKNVAEELRSARDGKRVIVIVQELSAKVFDMLGMSDIRRYGGYSRYAEELEADESRKAADAARSLAQRNHAFNLEVADMVHFMWRKKETKLLHGERNMNYLLHGKHSSKPLIQLTDL